MLIDRPGLSTALAARGIAAGEVVIVAEASRLPAMRIAHPQSAVLAVADDSAGEAAALEAGAEDALVAQACDALFAARAGRLLVAREGMSLGDLTIDPILRDAWREGRRLRLRQKEYALLAYLARHAGRTVPHDELLRAVFGLGFAPGTNVLAAQVSRLRAALDRGFAFPMLETDRGRGYRLVAAPGAAR